MRKQIYENKISLITSQLFNFFVSGRTSPIPLQSIQFIAEAADLILGKICSTTTLVYYSTSLQEADSMKVGDPALFIFSLIPLYLIYSRSC